MKRGVEAVEVRLPRKSAADFGAEYGFPNSPGRREVGPFTIGMSCSQNDIQITIFRAPQGGEPREDGFAAIDLMFSGKLEITRDDKDAIVNWNSIVNPIQMHHRNHFGPQRGLVISEMIGLLSQELIIVEETFRQHFYARSRPPPSLSSPPSSPSSPSKQAKKEEEQTEGREEQMSEDDSGEEEGGESHFDSLVNYDFGYMP